MIPDSPADLPQPVPAPPASIADPPGRLARLRREFADLYRGATRRPGRGAPPGRRRLTSAS